MLHFILTSEWRYQYHLAVCSAVVAHQPEKVIIWTIVGEPKGAYWRETTDFVSRNVGTFEVKGYEFEVPVPDIWVLKKEVAQLDILHRHGGLFLDLDTLSVKRIEMDPEKEAYTPPENIHNEWFNVAVFGCPKGSVFMRDMYHEALSRANNGIPYKWGDLGPTLATEFVLARMDRCHVPPLGEGGNYPEWDAWGKSDLPPQVKVLHLFNACQPEFDKITSSRYLLNNDNCFTRTVKKVLPEEVWLGNTGSYDWSCEGDGPQGPPMLEKELVVACYLEDIEWTRDVPPDWTVQIYYKESAKRRGLRNVGWEPYTYLTHIIENYDNLADVTVFCQGDANKHCPGFVSKLGTGQPYYGHLFTSDQDGRPWHDGTAAGPDSIGIHNWVKIRSYSDTLGLPLQDEYVCVAGAQYLVTREQIQSRHLDFYRLLLALSVYEPMSAWTLERLWPLIWGINIGHAEPTSAFLKGDPKPGDVVSAQLGGPGNNSVSIVCEDGQIIHGDGIPEADVRRGIQTISKANAMSCEGGRPPAGETGTVYSGPDGQSGHRGDRGPSGDPDARPTLHLLGLFHTVCNDAYSHCAFTGKVLRFPAMMQAEGWRVVEYSNGESQSTCNEKVRILEQYQLDQLIGPRKSSDFHGDTAVIGSKVHKNFCSKLRNELARRIKPGDIVCHPFGKTHEDLLQLFPDCHHVETGIGYPETMPNTFKIYESQAWRHYHLGKEGRSGGHYEWVIPNFFDESEWEVNLEPGKYVAFMGRVCSIKGMATVQEVAKRIDLPVVICGQGDATPWTGPNMEFRGSITGRQRSDFLRNAVCVLMPTEYVEPFGGVFAEAAFTGTSVCATSWGIFPEVITDGFNGFCCQTLREWLNAVEACKTLDRAAIAADARSKYSLEAVGPRYTRAFEMLANLSSGGWYHDCPEGRVDIEP